MRRFAVAALVALLALSVLADPYTFRASASDDVQAAPWWQTAVALIDLAAVIGVGVLAWRHRSRSALVLLTAEMLLNLAIVSVEVLRDGVSRFQAGFAAREYLSLYLAALAVRAVVLLLLVRPLREPQLVEERRSESVPLHQPIGGV